jgi:hypothetical protein
VVVLEYSAEFNGIEAYKKGRFEYINLWGKLCFATNYSSFENGCRVKYKSYNNRWV